MPTPAPAPPMRKPFALSRGTTASPNGGNVTVQRSYIHNNFKAPRATASSSGVLAWYSATPYITLQYDEFANNGYGDGLTHNMYIGCCGNMDFTLQYSWSHDSYVGYTVKDRAPINNILYNLIGDAVGNTSYLLDFPLGGSTYVVGNSLYKLATTKQFREHRGHDLCRCQRQRRQRSGRWHGESGPAFHQQHHGPRSGEPECFRQRSAGVCEPGGCSDASYSEMHCRRPTGRR